MSTLSMDGAMSHDMIAAGLLHSLQPLTNHQASPGVRQCAINLTHFLGLKADKLPAVLGAMNVVMRSEEETRFRAILSMEEKLNMVVTENAELKAMMTKILEQGGGGLSGGGKPGVSAASPQTAAKSASVARSGKPNSVQGSPLAVSTRRSPQSKMGSPGADVS
jgi:hypothetical protein